MGVYFSDFVDINPRLNLEKGKEYPFVEMGEVDPVRRYVNGFQKRLFKGGGTKFRSGDTLFARITPCLENGKIAQFISSEQIGFGSTEFFVFRAVPNISDPGFVYYLSRSDLIRQPAEKSMTGASGRQRADLNSIVNVEVPVVSLTAQRKIAAILSAYDDLIENNLRRIKILEEMAQNLYREWFVNFCFPGHEQTRFVDSPLGRTPEGWEIVKVGDVLEKMKRLPKVPRGNYVVKGLLPVIDQGKYFIGGYTDDENTIISDDLPVIIFGDHTRVLKYIDFPFARGADGTQILKSIIERMPMSLFFYTLSAIDLSNFAYARHFKFLKEEPIILPDRGTALMFERFVEPKLDYKRILSQANLNLRQTRDLILPKLIFGEVDVSELDIPMPEEVSA